MTSEFEEIGNWFLLPQVPYTRNKEYKEDEGKDNGKFRLGFYFINHSSDSCRYAPVYYLQAYLFMKLKGS